MSTNDDLFEGLKTDGDKRADFMERAADFATFKKEAGIAGTALKHGLGGAAIGGAAGAATAKPGESRLRRAVIGAGVGGAAGAGVGALRGRAAAATAAKGEAAAASQARGVAAAKTQKSTANAAEEALWAEKSLAAKKRPAIPAGAYSRNAPKAPPNPAQQAQAKAKVQAVASRDSLSPLADRMKATKDLRSMQAAPMGKSAGAASAALKHGLGGAALGGAAGAATAGPGESRLRRAVIGAGIGGTAGAGLGALRGSAASAAAAQREAAGLATTRAADMKRVARMKAVEQGQVTARESADAAAKSGMKIPAELMSPDVALRSRKAIVNAPAGPAMAPAAPMQGPARKVVMPGGVTAQNVQIKAASKTKTADAVLVPGLIGHLSSGSPEERAASPRSGILRGIGGSWAGGIGGGLAGSLVGSAVSHRKAGGRIAGPMAIAGLLAGGLGGAIAGGRSAKATPKELARYQMQNELLDNAISRKQQGKEKTALSSSYMAAAADKTFKGMSPSDARARGRRNKRSLKRIDRHAGWTAGHASFDTVHKGIRAGAVEARKPMSAAADKAHDKAYDFAEDAGKKHRGDISRASQRGELKGIVSGEVRKAKQPGTKALRSAGRLFKLKLAYLPPNPPSADSSINAREGELSAMAKVASPYGPNEISDAEDRAADKYPVEEVPTLGDEAMSAVESAKKMIHDARKRRAIFISGKKPRRERKSPIPVPDDLQKVAMGKVQASSILPKAFRDPRGIPIIAGGALALGLVNYLSSRPKKSLDGKSSAEHSLQADVASNKASATDDDGLFRRVRHRMKEFQSGLATDFRKSPLAAAGVGALVGGGIGSQFAKVLGVR